MDALSVGSNGNRKNRLRKRRRKKQEVLIAFLHREFMLTGTMKTRPKSPRIKQHLRKGGYVMCDPQ